MEAIVLKLDDTNSVTIKKAPGRTETYGISFSYRLNGSEKCAVELDTKPGGSYVEFKGEGGAGGTTKFSTVDAAHRDILRYYRAEIASAAARNARLSEATAEANRFWRELSCGAAPESDTASQ